MIHKPLPWTTRVRRSVRRSFRAINPFIQEVDQAHLAQQQPLNKSASFYEAMKQQPLYPGRHTQPINWNPFANVTALGNNLGFYFIPHKEPQRISVDDIDSGAWSPGGLVNILFDISPDVSKALWNNLRLSGTKVVFKAVTLKGDDDPVGQQLIEETLAKINPHYGGLDNTLIQLALSIYAFGACTTDTEIALGFAETLDMFPVVPDTIWFQRDIQQKPIPYQLQYMWGFSNPPNMPQYSNQTLPFRPLSLASFKYTPFDPAVDDPYGRGPFWPVLQVIFFLAQLLRDLQRVVENQAWPHTDFSFSWEVLQKMMDNLAPQDLHNPAGFTAFLQRMMAEVKQEYNNLSPQDAFVHGDFVTVTQNKTGGQLFDVPAVVNIVERQVVKALKQLPIFMDLDQSADTGESATQFEIQVHGIERVREILSDHVIFQILLNYWMHGHQGKVVSSWAEIRTTQRLQDAQADHIEMENAAYKRDQGWTTQDQASVSVTGSSAVKQTPDWDHLPGAKKTDTPKGEDVNTSSNTVTEANKSKNKRAPANFTGTDEEWAALSSPEPVYPNGNGHSNN